MLINNDNIKRLDLVQSSLSDNGGSFKNSFALYEEKIGKNRKFLIVL